MTKTRDLADLGGGFIQAGTGAVQRTVESKLQDVVSVKDFGAVGNGIADDTAAIQAAINAAIAENKDLFIPAGTYVVPAPSTSNTAALLLPESGTLDLRIFGQGSKSIIKVTDSKTNATAFSAIFGNTDGVSTAGGNGDTIGGYGKITFEKFKLLGTWDPTATARYGPNGFGFGQLDSFKLLEIELAEWPNKLTRVQNAESYIADSCKINFCASDGFRAQECSRVIITNNVVKSCDDDAVAVHTNPLASSAIPVRSEAVVSNNIIEDSEGIIIICGKGATVTGNTLSRTRGTCISVRGIPLATPEGRSPIDRVVIANNTIRDALIRCDANGTFPVATSNNGACIEVGYENLGIDGSGDAPMRADSAGVFTLPYGYYDTRDYTAPALAVGSNGIVVSNNVIMRTIPSGGTNYTDLGYGPYRSMDGTLTAAITETCFKIIGIGVGSDLKGAVISNNIVQSVDRGIEFTVNSGRVVSDNNRMFENIIVQGNIISDVGVGVSTSVRTSSNSFYWDINFVGNLIDCDPYHKHPDRNTDGTWNIPATLSLGCIGININRIYGCSLSGNVFKNCYLPVLQELDLVSPYAQFVAGDNFVYCEPVSQTYSASNKGVADPGYGSDYTHIIYDADPTSATFGVVSLLPRKSATVKPSAGTYVQGYFVKNSSPTVAAGKVPIGWIRLTTGSNHVTDVDWAAVYATTS